MTARACASCEWWIPAHEAASFGTCRAHPPAVDDRQSVWPATDADEWCGAFRMSEAAIQRGVQPFPSLQGSSDQ